MVPNPLFEILGLKVHLYGIFIALGILGCLAVFYVYTGKKKMSSKVQDFIFFVAIFGIAMGFVAAKFFQAVYNYFGNPSAGFNFATAGITVMGGLLGGAIMFLALYFGVGALVFRGENKNLHIKEFGKLVRVAPICIAFAHAFGRLGCLMAGCCHGAYLGTNYVFGGIWMRGGSGWGYYVPVQLYEALILFAMFGLFTFLYFKKDCNIILSLYLIIYGVWRFGIEFARKDFRGGVVDAALSPSQWTSIIFVVIGIGLLLFMYFRKIPFFLPKEELVASQEGEGVEVAVVEESGAIGDNAVEKSSDSESVEDKKEE